MCVCVYVCICVCVYIYRVYICIWLYGYIHVYTYIYSEMHTILTASAGPRFGEKGVAKAGEPNAAATVSYTSNVPQNDVG